MTEFFVTLKFLNIKNSREKPSADIQKEEKTIEHMKELIQKNI